MKSAQLGQLRIRSSCGRLHAQRISALPSQVTQTPTGPKAATGSSKGNSQNGNSQPEPATADFTSTKEAAIREAEVVWTQPVAAQDGERRDVQEGEQSQAQKHAAQQVPELAAVPLAVDAAILLPVPKPMPEIKPVKGANKSGRPSSNMNVAPQYRDFLDQWDIGNTFNHREQPDGYWLEVIEGKLPADLQGTYFRNGPGRFNRGPDVYDHPYDGDGLIASLAFQGGRAYFRSRFVRTPEYDLEQDANRTLFRGTFATQRSGGLLQNVLNLVIKNTSNTNIVPWGDSLLSLFEGGLPFNVDPRTLTTRGIETLNGLLSPGIPMDLGSASFNQSFGTFQRLLGDNGKLPKELTCGGGDAVTAHPHLDANTGRLCLFSYTMRRSSKPGAGLMDLQTVLTFRELPPGQLEQVASKEHVIDGYGFLHDFALTANYYIIFQPPVTVDMLPYIVGKACAASCVRFAPASPTLVHIVPRPGSDAERRGEVARVIKMSPPTFTFHHCNAYEEASSAPGQPPVLHIDSTHYDSLPAVGKQALDAQQVHPDAGCLARLQRTTIDLATGTLTLKQLWPDTYLELPSTSSAVSGRRHRYVYGFSSIFNEASCGVAKVDVQTGQAQRHHPGWGIMCLEPQFVPKPKPRAEDDGWLLTTVHDSNTGKSEFWVMDAWSLPSGPVAKLALPDALPHQLHGNWCSAYYGPAANA